MMWHEFRALPLEEQNEMMSNYEAYIKHELKHLQETFYGNTPIYAQERLRIEQLSLNDFLYSLKHNEEMGIWELAERKHGTIARYTHNVNLKHASATILS